MNIKKIAAAALAAACMVGMAACGGGSSDAKTDLTYNGIKLGETGKDIKAEITFLNARTDMDLDSYNGKNWKGYIEDFNKTYPNITVKTQSDSNYEDTALTRLQANSDNWDIMMIPSGLDASEYPTYFVSYGATDEVDKEVKLAQEKSYDGQTYGIATDGQTSGVVYNKRIFKEAGITELPKTPEEFIKDLKIIKEKTGATPLYTNYAAGWPMGAWDAYIGTIATGDDTYMNQKMAHTKDPFKNFGDDTHAYAVYNTLYEAVKNGLTEEDYSTTDWETSKTKMNNGDIATMVLGAWAVPQMKQAGDHPDDVGYMPFPISVDGKQYAALAGNYSMAINKNVSKEDQEASMIFVKWMVEQSGYAKNEGGISIKKGDDEMPAVYENFSDVTLLEDQPAKEGEEDLFAEVNSDSELGINSGNNQKVQNIVEEAANNGKTIDQIMDQWNKKWATAVEEDE